MAKNDVRYVISLEDLFSKKIKTAEKSSNSFEKSVTGLGKKLVGVFAAGVVINGIKNVTNEIIRATAEFEGFENAITFLSDGAEEGAKSMAFLKKNSNDLGISLRASIEGFQTLAGGFRGTGTGLLEIKDIFQKTSIAASAMNLSGERTKLVLLALGQMASKGVVSMEELRRQLGDSLPGAAGIGARAMGMTTQAFNKLVESGQLLATDFLPKFANELEKTFAGGLAKSTKSLRANLNRLENSFLQLKVGVGKKFNPQLKSSIKFMNKLIGVANKFVDIPMSENLEIQRKKLSQLIVQLNESTRSEGDRLRILNAIKEISPKVAAGIKKEGDQFVIATAELIKFNQQLLNRIVIQKQQEKIEKFRKLAAEKGSKAEDALAKIQEIRAQAIFKINKRSAKDAKLVQSILDGTIKRGTSFSEIAEKFGEKNAFLLNQAGLQISENSKDFINFQNIAIQRIAARNKLTREQIGFDEEFFDLLRKFNPLFNQQNDARNIANNLQSEALKLAKALGVQLDKNGAPTSKTAKTVIDDGAKEAITTISSAAPKTFNININKLVEKLEVNSTTIKEGAIEVKDEMVTALEFALADLQAQAQ